MKNCPACSETLIARRDCTRCGLSRIAIEEIEEVQEPMAQADLVKRMTRLIIQHDQARRNLAQIRLALRSIRDAMP